MTRIREGELFALLLSLIESLFPILSILVIPLLGPIHTYFFIICIAALALIFIVGSKEGFSGLVKKEAQKDLLLTAFFITLLFLLIFLGLQYTTAGNMAVILTLQLFFSYLYFNVIGREPMERKHTVGAFMMGTGAIVILFPENFTLNSGDCLILSASAVAPLANLFQKRARTHVSALSILAYRYLVALPFVFITALVFEPMPSTGAIVNALPYLIVIALLVYVLSKILWIEALHRIGITKLSAMYSFSPMFTLLASWMILGEIPGPLECIGIVPILVGAYMISRPV